MQESQSTTMFRLLKGFNDASDHIISPTDQWKHALWDRADIDMTVIRVPVCLIFFMLLWCIDIFVMDTIQLSYHQVLGLRQSGGSPLSFVLMTAVFFSVLYGFNITSVCQFMGFEAEFGVLTFYCFVLFSCVPFFPGHDSRMYFFRVMKQILFPGFKISFPEIMLADALCSLSRVFKDFGITIVVIYFKMYGSGSIIHYHNLAMIFVAILSSIPFAIRIRQCHVQLSGAKDYNTKIPIALNIIKYFSSFPPIWLSALGSLGYSHPLISPLIIITASINSLYSYAWDIIMDWGLFTFYSAKQTSAAFPISPPISTFSFQLHVFISILNLLLRFAWAASRLSFFSGLPSSHLIVLLEVAEIFRRSVWFIFRIEWEMVSVEMKKQEKKSLPYLPEKMTGGK